MDDQLDGQLVLRQRQYVPHQHREPAIAAQGNDSPLWKSQAAIRHDGPLLIDGVTNPDTLALPPKIDAKEFAGYGLYVAKQILHGRLF